LTCSFAEEPLREAGGVALKGGSPGRQRARGVPVLVRRVALISGLDSDRVFS